MKKFILIIIVTFIALTNINVSASNEKFYEGEYIQGIWVNRVTSNNIIYYQQFRVQRQKGTNDFAYCLEPFIPINENESYTSSTTPDNLTTEQAKKISLIAHFGYHYTNHYDIKWYAITQLMIWKTVMPNADFYFTDKLNGNRINLFQDEINEINYLIDNYEKEPSFNNQTFHYVVGQKIVITDYNQTINNYHITNGIGEINNNQLLVSSLKKGDYNLTLEKKDNYYNKPIIFYNSKNSQNLMETGNLNPKIAKVNINIDETKVKIKKLDQDNKNTENSGEGKLAGAIYELLDKNKTPITTIKIDENCEAEINNLTYQKYYLREKEAGIGYELDNNIYEFELSKDKQYIELNLTNKVIKANIIINKVYQTENGLENEANIAFEIYNHENTLIKTIITNELGNVNIELPYGNYTIKQITTQPGYEMIEPFSVNLNSNKEKVFNLINYKIKVPDTGIKSKSIIEIIKEFLIGLICKIIL